MNEVLIDARRSENRGDVRPLAEHLMEAALAFFDTEEGEAEYQAWKKARENARKGA